MALMTIVVSGVVIGSGGFGTVIGGNQSTISDSEINSEALRKAQDLIEEAAATARQDYAGVVATGPTPDGMYSKSLVIPAAYTTQCSSAIAGIVSWTGTHGRTGLSVGATTTIVNLPEMFALGGDCSIEPPPTGGWDPPEIYAYDTFSPGKPTALDALEHIAYMGEDNSPWLRIADARTVPPPPPIQNGGIFVPIPYANNFNSTGNVLDQINDIDVYKEQASGKVYAFAATASSTAQLVVLDVTDINNPVIAKNGSSLAKRSLIGVDPAGSFPEGWRIQYYDKKVYISTRETAGPEFHIFDVSDPTDPIELGSGTKLTGCTPPNGTTANDFVVNNGIAYLATSKSACEMMVYNVADPLSVAYIAGASTDFSGTEDGLSVFLLGTRLYFGRQKNSGHEIHMLNASKPFPTSGGFSTLASKEIGDDVTALRVVGPFAFAAVAHANEEFQVWPSDLSGTSINVYDFGNVVKAGFDYDDEWVFATGNATPNLTILYSP